MPTPLPDVSDPSGPRPPPGRRRARREKSPRDALIDETPWLRERIRARIHESRFRGVDPEDVLQETLRRAVQGLVEFRPTGPGSLRGWLTRIFENHLADLRRKRRRGHLLGRRGRASLRRVFHIGAPNRAARSPLSEPSPGEGLIDRIIAPTTSPSGVLMRDEALERLLHSIGELADDRRRVIVLRLLERRDSEDIAAIMGRSKDAVRMLFARALEDLAAILERERRARGEGD